MKKAWVQPRAVGQTFVPNEYVAACWKINCNVPDGYGYIDNNNNGQYDRRIDEKLTPDDVHGCNVWHTGVPGVPNDGPVANAMWHPDRGNDFPVYYWRDGKGRLDVHFSKVSDAQWETNPNAS